jgi:hypothetical protein
MLLINLFVGATRLQMGTWQMITPKLSPQTPARESFRSATAKIVTSFASAAIRMGNKLLAPRDARSLTGGL